MRTCSPDARARRDGRPAGLLLLLALAACAQTAPPPGGPQDQEAPRLVAAEPSSLAVGVAARAPLRLSFSERIERTSFPAGVEVTPARAFGKVEFDDLRVTLVPRRPWPTDTLVVWTVLPTVKDRHGVALGRPQSGAFTTGSHLPDGAITGQVQGKDIKLPRVRVALFTAPTAEHRKGVRWRLCAVERDGGFRIAPLECPAGPFRLEAFDDRDGNGRRDPREPVATADSLSITDAVRILHVGTLELVDRDSPVRVWVRLSPAPHDTLARRVAARPLAVEGARTTDAKVDTVGLAGPLSLVPGRYQVSAWADLDRDGRFGPDAAGESELFTAEVPREVEPAKPDTLLVEAPATQLHWATLDSMRAPPVPRDLFRTRSR